MKKILFILILFCQFAGFTQEPGSLSVQFTDYQMRDQLHIHAYLSENDFVKGQQMVDSIDVHNNGSISFALPADVQSGLLTLYLYADKNGAGIRVQTDILYDGTGDIRLSTNLNHFEDSLQDIAGGVNTGYLRFKKQKKFFESYVQALIGIYNQTRESDPFRENLAVQIEKTSLEQKQFFISVISNTDRDAASKLTRWELQSVLYNFEKPDSEALKENFLQRFDFSDPLLQRSKLLETIAQSYMFLYRDEGADAGSQKDLAIVAITNLMDKLRVNPEVLAGMAQLMARDFMQAGLDHIALFIQENYMLAEEGCHNTRTKEEILEDIEALKLTQPGMPAPEMIIDTKGYGRLTDIDSRITLVIFWADWCSHCKQVLPQYQSFLEKIDGVKVIAIALDEDEKLLEKAESRYPGWLHIQAPGKWDDPLVKQWAVHATPTSFILDKDKGILAKVKNLSELRQSIENYLEKIQLTQKNK